MPKHRTSDERRSSRRTSDGRRTSSSNRGASSNGFRLDGLRQGDRIEVFSAGNQLNGVGTFIRIRDGFLVWVNEDGNITSTSLDTISISRVPGTM
ncbi:hypothetical protein [Priestia megaterium]|jgi:hypothetical protein|uniref:hypothetical protein n=1 Tax=Priestia megaterium TaxID=1404 RepID=UPI0009EB63BA|nr:hypothetical protein [Priestia megaterium]MCT9852666.1 hypothetical protein [Priestia megaterium]MDF1964717.1 hypothetical protein [Priestia megaterium]MDF2013253.1 hypothetical protein [Priestia megaterium]MUL34234.1 hypothetical protein [Priestia megaterium]